tara:strand:+ start:590 stop:889 length:300 start_codon:yes stop_codon:yes gene_type:complete
MQEAEYRKRMKLYEQEQLSDVVRVAAARQVRITTLQNNLNRRDAQVSALQAQLKRQEAEAAEQRQELAKLHDWFRALIAVIEGDCIDVTTATTARSADD